MSKAANEPDTQLDLPPNPVSATSVSPAERLASIDAYRGLVMFLMMGEVLSFCEVSSRVPGNHVWEMLCHHQSHVEWVGCSLHDLIQPSFSFLVGAALPFSLASRLARGQSKARMTLHALWRSLILVFLGVFLRSRGSSQTNFTFEDTLSQIGIGYTFLFLIALLPRRLQWAVLAVILIGYWGAFGFIRSRTRGLTTPRSACRRAGLIIRPDLRRTGTKTATWRGRLTLGS